MKRYTLATVCLSLSLTISNSIAAQTYNCPTVDEIKQRNISREFDWTVSERTSLESLLSVNALLSVTIENQGEFLRCTYQANEEVVNLDGKPITVDCLVVPSSANWQIPQEARAVCQDALKGKCEIIINCQMIEDDK